MHSCLKSTSVVCYHYSVGIDLQGHKKNKSFSPAEETYCAHITEK